MQPTDAGSLAPLARTSAARALEALGDPRQQAFQRALAGQLGKSLQGQVLARLADGSALVQVDGIPARMQLPPGAQPGTEVALKLVALAPRPTFEVGQGAAAVLAEALPAGAALDYLDGAAAARSAPGQAADASHATLSSTGRLLAGVLAAAAQAGPAQAVTGAAPLAGAPTLDAKALAAALQQGIAQSGLFYESHVAEWSQGQRTLADLAAEPQMAGPRPGQPSADPATAQFISMQLATQEQASLAWQGQLWPGQPLRLELAREQVEPDGRGGGDGTPREPAWQSRLRLSFAGLGDLAASVVLAGEQLHIRLDAGPGAGELLRAHAQQLESRLAAAGTPLATLAIHDGASPDA